MKWHHHLSRWSVYNDKIYHNSLSFLFIPLQSTFYTQILDGESSAITRQFLGPFIKMNSHACPLRAHCGPSTDPGPENLCPHQDDRSEGFSDMIIATSWTKVKFQFRGVLGGVGLPHGKGFSEDGTLGRAQSMSQREGKEDMGIWEEKTVPEGTWGRK